MNKIELDNWDNPDYYKVEDFNTLYANIKFSSKIKVLGVVSSLENEGKTFVTLELLRAYARDNKKVVVVDADLRKSKILLRYSTKGLDYLDLPGLSNYLVGEVSSDKIVYETSIPNAYIIPTGHESMNPSNLLDSEQFSNLIEKLEEDFDMILVDMPPLNSVIDGAIIASRCKNILFVIKSNSTDLKAVKYAKAQIERAHGLIIGTVLNMVSVSDKIYNSYGSYYHSKKYLSYYNNEEKKGLFKRIFKK